MDMKLLSAILADEAKKAGYADFIVQEIIDGKLCAFPLAAMRRSFELGRKDCEAELADRDLIERTIRDWWHGTVRHGMTSLEAGRTLTDALDAAGLKITTK